jgi:dTDP-4-dehydrorhamnose reductase
MKFLVTGANGYLGARIHEDLGKRFESSGTFHSGSAAGTLLRLDITDREQVRSVFDKVVPDTVVHAAGVPTQKLCDKDPELARKVNVEGSRNVALAAEEIGAKVVYISTTAVLDPVTYGAYGATKLAGETQISTICKRYLILRPGLIIGGSPNRTNDRFQNRLLNNITKGVPAVYDNQEKYEVTWAGHISEVIVAAEDNDISREVIPVLADGYRTRFEIASDALKHFGIKVTGVSERKALDGEYATTSKLRELGMPTYTYGSVVEKVISEIEAQLSKEGRPFKA